MTTPDAAASVFGEALGAAEHYVDILAGRGVEWGLIGPRETDRLWERHVLNSVAVADVVPTVGCPAKGNLTLGVKIRMRPDAASSTNTVSL